jgi:hypothetical protein
MTLFNQDELATLNDDQLRGALFAIRRLHVACPDKDLRALHTQVSQALIKSITSADPHTTPADVRYFAGLAELQLSR